MSKKLKWIIGILIILIILLVVLSKAGVLGKDEGIKITAEKAATRDITETVTATGKVFPEVEVKVSPDISGEIVELNVEEGDTVRRGQVLAKIYADIYASQRDEAAAIVAQSQAQVLNSQAQLGALKATLDQTESAYKRQKTLLDQKVISQSEFETAQQAYESAKANYLAAQSGIQANKANVQNAMAGLTRANKDVGRATIIAPMDGVISLLSVKKGERVAGNSFNIGTEMMRIADLSSIEVQVDVGENDIPKVKLGDTAIVEVDAFNNRKFKGVVYKIANPEQSLTGSSNASSTSVTNYEVHIRLLLSSYQDLIVKGQPFPFRPNMTASADIQTQTHSQVLSVPLNAVTTRTLNDIKQADTSKNKKPIDVGSNSGDSDLIEVVFVVQPDGKVKLVPVKTSIQDINNIEVTSGLKTDEQVVTGPYDIVSKTMKNGDKVKVVSKDELVKGFAKK
ncbi:MAG TPA: efflux RND transporter periplasmic adaptor subunit [Parafilimonas sp.]|nr:efflux RND transporter periplasmic adaptor subunit [Parafilimonas sp.]